jgi:hypothetical protein
MSVPRMSVPQLPTPPHLTPPHPGTIPTCMSELKGLELIDLSVNHLHGTIPSSLCQAGGGGLTYLALDGNELSGRLAVGRWSLVDGRWSLVARDNLDVRFRFEFGSAEP